MAEKMIAVAPTNPIIIAGVCDIIGTLDNATNINPKTRTITIFVSLVIYSTSRMYYIVNL